MSVALRRQRNGKLRPFWYGEYVETNGRRKVINLGEWKGTPPPTLLGTGDATAGNAEFEASREEAERKLQKSAKEARRKGRVDHLTERLIESKTGRTVEYTKLVDLPVRWRNLGREAEATEAHLGNCDAHFRRFTDFMHSQNPAATYLYEVTAEDAAAFLTKLRHELAPATAQYGVRLVSKALSRFLPVGSLNPFAEFVGRRKNSESGVVHRKPFTPDELRALLETSRHDDFMHPLIVTAACSGMRRGDVCTLKWADVDMGGGMLTVKTSKTGGDVEIPIFAPLRNILEERRGKNKGFVFPEAEAMMRNNSNGLSYRFKALVAKALDEEAPNALPEPIPAAEVETDGVTAIMAHVPDGDRRVRLLDTFKRYMGGQSVRLIAVNTGRSKGTISYDLHIIAGWTGKRFVRSGPGRHTKGQTWGVKAAIDRVTREKRERGQKAASIRDWHALRTTFVTLALSAGVPIELVRRVTGHATVETVLKHYFRPDREQFRAALAGAMPDVLTGLTGKRLKTTPTKELSALVAKLSDGTATERDKTRLRELAAKV
jgi:integrase